MADVKLTDEPELSVPALDDWLAAVDKSDTTDNAAGSDVKVSFTRGLGLLNHVCQGRITLVSGDPHYAPQAATPSSTNTSTEEVTINGHGWQTGTIVTPSITVGGLTAWSYYYVRAVDANTIAFYNTFAAADADTSRIDLTASITAELVPMGRSWDVLYFMPYEGNLVSLYDGTRWRLYSFSELSLAISGLTAGKNYDVFLYDNAGTLTLELSSAWTTDTARADGIALQDGVEVKSGAATRRRVGLVRAIASGELGDHAHKKFLVNRYQRIRHPVRRIWLGSYTYTSSTVRQMNADALNQVELVSDGAQVLQGSAIFQSGASNADRTFGVGMDSTTTWIDYHRMNLWYGGESSSNKSPHAIAFVKRVPLGYHKFCFNEQANGGIGHTGKELHFRGVVES